jgi:hypothetical protein
MLQVPSVAGAEAAVRTALSQYAQLPDTAAQIAAAALRACCHDKQSDG